MKIILWDEAEATMRKCTECDQEATIGPYCEDCYRGGEIVKLDYEGKHR